MLAHVCGMSGIGSRSPRHCGRYVAVRNEDLVIYPYPCTHNEFESRIPCIPLRLPPSKLGQQNPLQELRRFYKMLHGKLENDYNPKAHLGIGTGIIVVKCTSICSVQVHASTRIRMVASYEDKLR